MLQPFTQGDYDFCRAQIYTVVAKAVLNDIALMPYAVILWIEQQSSLYSSNSFDAI